MPKNRYQPQKIKETFEKHRLLLKIEAPLHLEILDESPSSQESLREILQKKCPEGTCLLVENQKSGRGRLGRSWESPAYQNIAFSLLLKPVKPLDIPAQMALVTGLACHRAFAPLLPGLTLKWPNDLWIANNKIAGILCEMETSANQTQILVGLGINLNSKIEDFSGELRSKITSFQIETGKEWDKSEMVGLLIAEIFHVYAQFLDFGFSALKKEWESKSFPFGTKVRIPEEKIEEAYYSGLSEEGYLKVKTSQGEKTILAGDVVWL